MITHAPDHFGDINKMVGRGEIFTHIFPVTNQGSKLSYSAGITLPSHKKALSHKGSGNFSSFQCDKNHIKKVGQASITECLSLAIIPASRTARITYRRRQRVQVLVVRSYLTLILSELISRISSNKHCTFNGVSIKLFAPRCCPMNFI